MGNGRRDRTREEAAPGLDEAVRQALERSGLTVGEPLARREPGRPVTYRGLDPRDRHVAVRVVDLPDGATGAALLRRLAGLRSLRHPGLARVHEVLAVPGGRAAVTTELMPGADLAVVLAARGGLTRSEAARLLDDLGSALAHLHAAGLVHGDVAPGNVVVTTQGRAVLVDLVSGVTETGTAGCAAPEVEAGGPATPASDVYALARLLESCAAGSASLRETLTALLPDALDPDPRRRPTARALAARAHGLARPGTIELPDGARLAAGALRAAAAAPTRAVPSRRDRLRGPATAWGGAARRVPRALAVPVLVMGLALAGAAVAAVRTGSAPAPDAGASVVASGGTGSPTGVGAAAGTGTAGAEEDAGDSGEASAGEGAEEAAVRLASERDAALEAADGEALALTTVEGSPAATSDRSLLASLTQAGETVQGLRTRVTAATDAEVPRTQRERWPSAVGLRVTLEQSASRRLSPDGREREVTAPSPRSVVLVLVPGPWRVAEVLPAP